MARKIYMIVGNWGFAPAPKGITSYEYNESTGELSFIENIRPDVAAGQLCIDNDRAIAYVNNECGDRRGEIGGGGYVMAYRIDPLSGKLSLINEKETLFSEPSYVAIDISKRYIVVCHCADPWHITRLVKGNDGSFSNEVLFDDTGLVLFRLGDDGSISGICDVSLTSRADVCHAASNIKVDPVTKHIQLTGVISRQHMVVPSPSGELYVVCDKGLDRIYTYRIDRETGKLVKLDEFCVERTSFPRYAAFHPKHTVFYANNENSAILNSFRYDEATGKMERLARISLLEEDVGLINGKPVGSQDILVHPAGKALYVTLSGLDTIVLLSLDEEGTPKLKQAVHSAGILPRGLAISPDGHFLLSGNMISGDITTFEIQGDFTLKFTGKSYKAVSPSALRFFTAEV